MADIYSPLLDKEMKTTKLDNYSSVLIDVSSFTLFITAAVMIINAGGYSNLGPFIFHPLFQLLGFTIVVNTIKTLQPATSGHAKVRGFEKHRKLIGYLALPSFILGSSSMLYNKYLHSATHFTSGHSKLGLLTGLVLVVQSLVGVLFTIPSKDKPLLPKSLYKVHRLSGYFILLPLLALTIAIGFGHSTWSVLNAPEFVRLFLIDGSVIIIVFSLWSRIRLNKLSL